MQIKCQNAECGYIINIPPDRVPQKPVKIACPKCKGPNIIKPPVSSGPDTDNYARIMAEVDRKISALRSEMGGQGANVSTAQLGSGEGHVITDAGPKKALICDDDKLIAEMIKDITTKMGFVSEVAPTIEQALSMLEDPDMDYGLVLIDKVFPDDAEGGYKILSKIAVMPLDRRRRMFVIFISGDIKSMDTSSAFLTGANTVVNKKDINKLAGIISNELGDYEKLYSVFNQCLHLSKSYTH